VEEKVYQVDRPMQHTYGTWYVNSVYGNI